MEPEKKGSIFGTVFVVIILLGLVVYYLSNKNSVRENPEIETQSETDTTPTNETGQNSMQSETELETEVENLDTEFSDMNAEDLDM